MCNNYIISKGTNHSDSYKNILPFPDHMVPVSKIMQAAGHTQS